MLTNGLTTWVDVPHEPGQRIQIRMLPWPALKDAQETRTAAALQNARAMGGDLLSSLSSVERTVPAEVDDLAGYDVGTLLRAGIVGWTYDAPVAPGTIADLDDVTAPWAAREILRYSHPASGDTLKNSFAPSTAPSTV